ncbi:Ltp family lipoprotein [Gudongella oleilytica]|jgi:uncharacterized protein (UPF0128 family)|uniref:Ltp family lipoprotein n=1 Tax=Gudongella oleilytica TaxID=1582259 RepID=UPI002A36C9B5|nr:Ltp family lipoprotein [Gudongella oleilytica]MDY0256592.1 Ltp family lipoprotein [Gudongella oleilytica]
MQIKGIRKNWSNDERMERKMFLRELKYTVLMVSISLMIALTGCGGDNPDKPIPVESQETVEQENSSNEQDTPKVEYEVDDGVPTEFKSALKKAKQYSDTMHMSKASLFVQLTSEYGEKFSEDAANYAIENVVADWKENALRKAENYADTMYMSKAGIYDQLVSEYGEQFTEEEAQYAINNVVVDWKENALMKAKSYQETMAMSPEAIRDQLTSEYGEKFTQEEADYAIDNLD